MSLDVPRLRTRRQTLNIEQERQSSQIRAFTMWVNHYLRPHGCEVKNLDTDLGSGVPMVRLAEGLTGQTVGKFNQKPNNDIARLDNISLALKHLVDDGVKLHNTHKEHILEGNTKIILGFLWNLIQHYQVQSAPAFERDDQGQAVELSAKEKLLRWVRARIAGITDHKVTNFDSDFQDGIVYMALVHAADADAIAMEDVVESPDEETQQAAWRQNLVRAFKAAEDKLGIPQMLEPLDVLLHPDDLATMTYVSYFRSPPPVLDNGKTEELGSELERVKAELEAMRSENGKLKQRVKDLEVQLAVSEEARAKTLESIQSERDALQQQHNADLHDRDTHIEDLKAELEEVRQTLKESRKEGEEKSEQIQSLEKDAKLWEEKVKRLEEGLRIIPALEEQLTAYKALLDESDSLSATSEEALRKKEEALRALNEKGKQLEEQTAQQQSAMSELEGKIQAFEAQKRAEEEERQRKEEEARLEAQRKAEEEEKKKKDLIAFLAQGSVLDKYTHHGKGKNHERFFKCTQDLELSWANKETSKSFKSITVRRVARGSAIPNNPSAEEALCFTILSPQYSNLTVKAKNAEDFEKWVSGLELLVSSRAKKRRSTLSQRDEAALNALQQGKKEKATPTKKKEKSTPNKEKKPRDSDAKQGRESTPSKEEKKAKGGKEDKEEKKGTPSKEEKKGTPSKEEKKGTPSKEEKKSAGDQEEKADKKKGKGGKGESKKEEEQEASSTSKGKGNDDGDDDDKDDDADVSGDVAEV